MGSDYIITSNGNFIGEDDLRHWGIKGMKWGVRRYQNADGTLTAAGKKRYTNPDGSLNEKGKNYYTKEMSRLRAEKKSLTAQKKTNEQLAKLDVKRKENDELKKQLNPKKEEAPKRKDPKTMTDEELDRALTRVRKEDEYNRLRPEPKAETKNENYKKIMTKTLNEAVVPALINSGKNALQKVMDKQINELLKDKLDPNSKEALQIAYDKLKLQKDIEKLKKGTTSMDEVQKAYNLRTTLMKDAKVDDDTREEEARKLLKQLGWSDD